MLGKEEGYISGKEEGLKETAMKMKNKGIDFETISECTNLLIEEIEKL